MPNKMLIDATHPEETRVVVLRGNRVEEFDFESASRRQLRGNIYLAKVTRVEPSLQAAFIDYGGNRHGFLAFSEIHPDYYQIPVADRQVLIDEEERAHRAADAEADRRAAARTAGRSVPASRGGSQRRQSSVASAPVEQPADADDRAPAAGDDQPFFEEAAEFGDLQAGTAEPDDSAPEDGSGTGGEQPVVAAETVTSEAGKTSFGVPVPLDTGFGADLDEMLGVGEPERAVAAGDSDEGGDALPDQAGTVEPAEPYDDGMSATPADTDEIAEDSDDFGGDSPAVTVAGAPDVGEDEDEDEDDGDEDDEDGDEDDDEDDDDEEEEVAEAEEGVEMVGGADALEEVHEPTHRVRRQYKIQEVIKRRQIMLVQVVKEERGTKGAALTTYLSLAGRYSVLMPNTARGGGISRKITSPQDRNRLKEIAHDLEVPEGMGVILRTAGAARTKTEIKRDFEYLLRMWEQVRDMTLKSTAPTLVYEEGSVVKRAIRDLYSKDIDEVLVAGDGAFREAKDFMRMLMPSHAKNVKQYNENLPLLIRYGVESQLDAMFSPIVQLRSGGYIVLNQTEALVAIDVNSGRATREHHIEDTALKTNLEAAEEIARQLRLRDLAGLVVIDFIDMDEKRNNRAVERRLKECLKNDRARIQVGRISHFGLLEMSRQRLRTSVFESSTEKCPHCGGTGHMRSVSSVALQCLRMLEETLLRGATHNIVVRTTSNTALYMLNQKRGHLRDLEQRFQIIISIRVDESQGGAHPFAIEKGEQVHSLEHARALAAQPAMLAPSAVPEEDEFLDAEAEVDSDEIAEARDEDLGEDGDRGDAGENGGRRRRRRRRRGGRRGEERAEAGTLAEADHGDAEEPEGAEGGEGAEAEDEASGAMARGSAEPAEGEEAGEAGDASAEQRRRRRRGRRGGRRNRRAEGESDAEAGAEAEADGDAEAAAGGDGEPGAGGEFVRETAEAGEYRFSFVEAGDESTDGDGRGDEPETRFGAAPALERAGQDELAGQDERAGQDEPEDQDKPVQVKDQAAAADLEADDFLPFAPQGTDTPSAVSPPAVPAEQQPEEAVSTTSEDETVGADSADTASETAEAAAQPAPPRRRSTIREPVGFAVERSLVVTPVPSVQPVQEVSAAEPGDAEAEAAEQPAARRTGWWSRRIIGNKS